VLRAAGFENDQRAETGWRRIDRIVMTFLVRCLVYVRRYPCCYLLVDNWRRKPTLQRDEYQPSFVELLGGQNGCVLPYSIFINCWMKWS